MSADLLRRAAKKLRAVAELPARRPDRWITRPETSFETTLGFTGLVVYEGDPQYATVAATAWPGVDEYIRTLDPPVALALADLLDSYVWTLENTETPLASLFQAIAVARAVLREPGDTP